MISQTTVDTTAQLAADAADVAQAFIAGVDEARDAYVDAPAAAKAEAWSAYTHALDQMAAANHRANAAKQLHSAVAHAKNLADAWQRLQRLPELLHGVPTTEQLVHAVPLRAGGNA